MYTSKPNQFQQHPALSQLQLSLMTC